MNSKNVSFSGGLTPMAPTVSETDVERPYKFEQISADGKLWAAVYNGQDKNAVHFPMNTQHSRHTQTSIPAPASF